MTVTDIIILVMVFAGGAYGLVRGVRPGLYLLIALLCSVLATMYLTTPVENLLMHFTIPDAEAYRDAPGVAAFIMEGDDVMAYTASLIPAFLTILIIVVFSLFNMAGRHFLTEPGKGVVSRISGFLVGLIAGAVLALLFAVVLVRLPRPLAGSMFRESILINTLSGVADYLLPALAGGM